jgi:chromosome segregation ATPase
MPCVERLAAGHVAAEQAGSIGDIDWILAPERDRQRDEVSRTYRCVTALCGILSSMAARRPNGGRGNERGDEHLVVLRAIWNEMKGLNSRVDKTNERLESARVELREEISELRGELKEEVDLLRRRVVESEVRLATATTQLSSDVQELTGLIREWREEHRADRAELRMRVARLEAHVGLAPKA